VVGVVAFVTDQPGDGCCLTQQRRGDGDIGNVAAGQTEGERPAGRVDQRVDFDGAAATRATGGLAALPPLWNGPPLSSTLSGLTRGDEAMDVKHSRDRLGQELLQRRRDGPDGTSCAAPADAAGEHRWACGKAAGPRGSDGGVLWRVSPRTAAGRAGARGAADVAGICLPGCRSDAESIKAASRHVR